MRKNLSIIGLCLQGTLFRILGVLVIMMTAEIGIFYFKLQSFDRVLPLFEDIADCLPIKLCWIFGLSYVVYAAFDFLTRKNNLMSAYTVARLSVKETTMYLMIALFNLFAIIIAWAVQVGTLILMGQIYIAANTAAPYSPVLFLAFYRSSFLHVLLPLGDILGWIVVFLIWAALALSASVAIKKMYYTKKAFGGNVATVILLLTLTGDYDLTDGFACGIVLIFAIALIGTSIYGITSSWSNDRDLLSSEDEPNTEETGVTES